MINKVLNIFFRPFLTLQLFNISFSFCIGIIIANIITTNILIILFILLLLIFILVFIFLSNKSVVLSLGLFILFLLIGSFRLFVFRSVTEGKNCVYRFNGQEVLLEGKVDQKMSDRKYVIKPNKIVLVKYNNTISKLRGKVIVKTDSRIRLSNNNVITIRGILKEPEDFDGFSYKSYLKIKGIYSILSVDKIVNVSENGKKVSIDELKIGKEKLVNDINEILSVNNGSLLSGIVFGGNESMSEEFENALSRTGTTHIIAVSGYNINVLITSINFLNILINRRRLTIITIVFIFLFTCFVGVGNIPVVRAGLMGISLMISRLVGKKGAILVSLSLTIAILLLFNPLIYKLLSFQLSFLSTISLIFFSSVIKNKIKFIPEFLREDVASTLSAILFTIPVTLGNFGEISIIAPITNLLVLPAIPFITVFGFVFIIVLIVFEPLARILSYPLWLVIEYITNVIYKFSELEIAVVRINERRSNGIIGLLIMLIIYVMIKEKINESKKAETN